MVIPTRNRPAMALAAVRSALTQTHPPHEVIVILDGPEDATTGKATEQATTPETLAVITDLRLRVIALPSSVGGGQARNLGVEASSGEWIAFLDDDDLWLPDKLEVQLRFLTQLLPVSIPVLSSPVLSTPVLSIPVLSCPVLARSPHWEEVWPHVSYRTGQPMAEYLFCRRGMRYGSALLQTSTLLAPRDLLLRIPFTPGLRKHQDWDWLLRVSANPAVSVHSVGTLPLAVFHVEGERSSVGRAKNWRFSLDWAHERRAYFTPRAFSGFVATECAAQAQSEPWRERTAVLRALLGNGFPPLRDLARAAIFLLVPQNARRAMREWFRRPARSGIRLARFLFT